MLNTNVIWVEYDMIPEILFNLESLYMKLKSVFPDCVIYYIPNTKKAFDDDIIVNYDVVERGTIENYDSAAAGETWLVFSKTHKGLIGLADNYKSACSLMAKWKFDGTIPYTTCGVALFEDYYFMPLVYPLITIYDIDKVVLSH